MNFLEQLKTLDRNDIGRWPLLFRGLLIGVIFFVVMLLLSYYFVWNQQRPELLAAEEKEQELKKTFEGKQLKAANLEAYKKQLTEMDRVFGAMLRELPSKTEVPSLLTDISQTGLGAGLDQKLFQPSDEVKKDFYAEKPIKVRYTGSYHQLGSFVSAIAALPRIVTLHDIEINPAAKDSDQLTLDATAKTYRYLEDDETASSPPK